VPTHQAEASQASKSLKAATRMGLFSQFISSCATFLERKTTLLKRFFDQNSIAVQIKVTEVAPLSS